ncbi:uncharacterized protein BJ171DRAFT_520094 [Polychytrium aggregatum]|uniref:uncharacterized protein n=1 Tax=Polychytrium aggregatum TaxID=110093 RepID=UPI0022FDFD1B|nr:uncharacterized protein BJ171DRAFT_520094 [Polychytrium aggregatum]KAI9197371.1 hypothetical protein BJ171DRAFT_520094 [Polychytrium aggregatum]
MSQEDWNGRWDDIDMFLDRSGPFAQEQFEAGDEVKSFLHDDCKILVIGAGGLGCELLKDLALSGFKDIHVIDMDTIDISNLNRQFLFRQADVGKPKAEVAAKFVMERVPGCIVTPYFGKIQDKDEEYYSQFSIIICGLDSVEARRWINATVVNMYDPERPETLKPIVDGGTEGFKGQARVILPRITACYECSLDMQTKPTTFPMCTIANAPRLPEHCIEWASIIQWPNHFPGQKVDGDSPEHIKWLFDMATDRAKQFGITGVTYSLTQGVVKNIIPAIASTNAIVAAACANEAFKLATNCVGNLDNYMLYVGDQGIYTYTFELQRKEECPVCGSATMVIHDQDRTATLQEFIDSLTEISSVQLKKPSLRTSSKSLFMQSPPALREATLGNLDKILAELLLDGDVIYVTDTALPISLQITVYFKNE